MNGHLKTNKRFWFDASLDEMKVDYDYVDLNVEESCGRLVTLRCKGYIGFELSGFWDEAIIESAEICEDEIYSSVCWEKIMSKYNGSPPKIGSLERNNKNFKTLKVILGDGAILRICASNFELGTKEGVVP